MLEYLLAVFIVFLLLDIASLLWGAESRERWDSPEWLRRQQWAGFH